MKSTILVIVFMCPYGGAKSVIAMSYFNQLAQRAELPYRGVAVAGETPYEAVPENVATFLSKEGFEVTPFKPRRAEPADFQSAFKVVSVDCDLSKIDTKGATVERWDDVPKVSVDLPGSAAAIRKSFALTYPEMRPSAEVISTQQWSSVDHQ